MADNNTRNIALCLHPNPSVRHLLTGVGDNAITKRKLVATNAHLHLSHALPRGRVKRQATATAALG